MAVNLVRKSKNEDEEERRKQLLAQMQQNSQARKDAEIQSVKDMKLNWVDPTTTGFRGATNRIGWIGRNAKAGGEKSLLDTLSAFGQTTQVGLQRGANQAAQENSTWDKIKNFGKNALKAYAYTTPDFASKLLYMATIGRQDIIDENNQVASQIAQNYSQAQTGFGKAGAIAGGVTSKVFQDSNALLQGIYAGGQQVGQILGEDKTNQTIENMNELDTKLHKKNDKELEELQRQGTLYGGVTRKLGETGQTIGYMTPSIAIGLATGGAGETAGLVQMGFAAKGSTTREAMQQGADLETAERKGVASGTAEALSEKMFGGLKAFKPFKESGVEDVAKKYIAETIEKRISSQLGQTVAKTAGNWLVDVTGETIEELTTDIYNTWLDQATTDPNAQYTLDDAINTAVGTALSTTVLNVGYAGLNKGIQKVYDRNQARANNQESIPEAERTESNGYKENLQEMVNNLDIPEEVKAQIQPMLDSNATINAEEYKDITNNIKTLVKANTQQQIQNYGAELTTQYNAIEEQRQSLDNIKPESFKNKDYRRLYAQLINESELQDETYDNILTLYPTNKNGNRPLSDWQNIARDYGKAMAEEGRSFDEVRHNIVKIWTDEKPFDRQQTSKNGQKVPTQRWYPIDQFSKMAYDSYRDTMKTQLDQQQKDLADTANARLEEIQDEENILIDTIDNLKPRATAEQVAKTKKLVEDFAKARGVNVEYNAEVFKNNNEEAFIKDNGNGERTIYINPNADPDTILVKLATHEMFHDTIRTQPHDKLTQLVMDRLKADENYDMYRQSVVDAYLDELNKLENTNKEALTIDELTDKQNALVDEEMTAKYLGEYLGDEQFVQQLVNSTNRSTIQKIMDWIDNRLQQIKNVVTGNKEAEYWRKVRENFEKAYNSKYQGEQGKYFSKESEKQNNVITNKDNYNSEPKEGYIRLYTNTKADNLDAILKEGLRTDIGRDVKEYEGNMLWFETTPDLKGYGGTTIAVDIPKNSNMSKVNNTQYTVYDNISPDNIVFIDKPAFNHYRTSDLNELVEKYGKDKVLEVYDKSKNKSISREELVNLIDNIDSNTNNTTTDNQGRTLTKEQQEYFKDSKVRDENGNLLEVYHSTPEFGFTIFDKEKLSRSPRLSQWGKGFYFTDNEIASADYKLSETGWSDNSGTYKTYLNITNPLILNNSVKRTHTLDRAKLTQLLLEGNNDYFFDSWIPFEIAQKELNNDKTFTKEQLQKMSREEKVDKYLQYNFDQGYTGDQNILSEMLRAYKTNTDLIDNFSKIFNVDGIIVKGGRANQYIAFNSNQIKNVDNLNPTDNPDIRYSKKSKFDDYLKQDNQGRELSEEQKEYFKDSKARDENGNLVTVYHGTNKAGFTRFNQMYNYYTDNKNVAQSYTQGDEMVDTRKLESVFDAKTWLKGITDEAYINGTTVYDEYGNEILSYDNADDLVRNLKQDIINELGNPEAGGTYEGYVNITNPIEIDAQNEKWSTIPLDSIKIDGIDNIQDFLNKYGSDTWEENGKTVTSTNDIVTAIIEARDEGIIDNDGIIIKNVRDEGGYGNVLTPMEAGTDYITFKDNQFKAADNRTPTTEGDIRYSKKTKFDEALKQKQNEIIQKENPMDKSLGEHTWINSVDDIKTYQEALEYDEYEGQGMTPDYTNEMVQEALRTGKMTVYSSYPIENGIFVTPSKMEAQNYAGNNKVYSKEVDLTDVAWIDGLQGQYAKVDNAQSNKDNQGRTLSEGQQKYFEDSKARDKNGNLLEVYHGTNSKFTVFDKSYLGTGSGDLGFLGDGFYLATHKGEASYYGSDVMSGYVNLKNPFNIKDLNKYNGEYLIGEDTSAGLRINNLVKMNEQWGDLTTNGYTYKEISDEVDNFLNNVEIKRLGDVVDSSDNTTGVMWQVSYNGNNYETESIPSYKQNEILADALNKHIKDNFGYLDSREIIQNIASENMFNKNIKSFSEVLQENGYDSIVQGTPQTTDEIVIFNSNQFKNTDNLNPTDNEDINLNIKSKAYDDYLKANNPNRSGVTIGDLQQRLPVNQLETTQPILPTTNVQATTENLEIPNEQTSIPLGEQVNPSERKQRKTYKSIIESPVMSEEAKKVARKFIGQDTYTPDSNLKQLERADNIISRLGTEKALNQLESNAMEGRTIKAEDIATGDRLIEYYSKIGDSENLQRAIRATAMAGTQAGRSVQAFALLKHQTPQGMAIWIQNSVDKLNSQMKKGQFDFTPEMQEKILNSTEENLQENANEVMKELGQQVPQDLLGKLDSWRYFSMLANPKTHIRNIVGNFAMGLTQQFKSKVAGTIEQVTGQDRTHTSFLEKRNKANIDFAKNDLKNVSAQLGIGESKYSNPKTQIQQNQRVFKSDVLEKTLGRLFNLNDKLLEAEDNFGLKNAYVRNLSDYMTANKLNPNTITNEQLQQARKIAIEEALRATFHQESSLASMLSQLESKNSLTRTLVGGLVPFKKTPINVAKSGFEYSPAGLAKAIVYDSVQLRKGNINVNEYIDNISKGLTGTGIALVGYALAEAGILKAAGDDDKEDKYKEAMGEQPYSITINGKSFSLDWLAPTGIPLFVGAELNKLVHDTTEKEGETQNGVLKAIGRVTDATSSLLNPMSEMSMISGLTSTLQSYSQDPGQALMNLPINMLKSYTNQFVPTAVGQVARTMDKYERDTSSTETGLLPKAIDQTKNQIMNKIPGLRQLLPTKKDIWGNEVETQDYFHNAVLPYTKKEIKTNAVDKELNDLFERTGESIYPSTSLSKTVTYEGSKTRLTNQDYNEFKENYGKTSYNILKNLISSKEYKSMTDEQKVKEIKDVYTYANNLNKTEYAEKKGIKFETPNDIQDVKNIKSNGGTETDYFKYKAITAGIDKDTEKVQALRDSSLSSKSKKAIYLSVGGFSGNYGKKDTFYPNTNIDINEYLDYKTADIQGVKDSNGKTINGTKKQAQLDYINNNISGYENRLLLMGKDYKLSRSQQQDLAEYIYTLDNAEDLFAMYDKNFTVRDGTVYYK